MTVIRDEDGVLWADAWMLAAADRGVQGSHSSSDGWGGDLEGDDSKLIGDGAPGERCAIGLAPVSPGDSRYAVLAQQAAVDDGDLAGQASVDSSANVDLVSRFDAAARSAGSQAADGVRGSRQRMSRRARSTGRGEGHRRSA